MVADHHHVRLAPPVACTAKNRMDIFIDEDDIMWACECEMLKTGTICRWQVIGGVDKPSIRKHHRYSIGKVILHVAL